MKPIYHTRRRGSFTAKSGGLHPCGLDPINFLYQCEVETYALDDDGFVIDNVLLDTLCVTDYMDMSCEHWAASVAGKIYAHLREHYADEDIIRICVTVGSTHPVRGPNAESGVTLCPAANWQVSMAPPNRSWIGDPIHAV